MLLRVPSRPISSIRGIRVNAVAPSLGRPLTPATVGREDSRIWKCYANEAAPQPEEIAPAFVFLAAPSCSSFITGEVLPIIGGVGWMTSHVTLRLPSDRGASRSPPQLLRAR